MNPPDSRPAEPDSKIQADGSWFCGACYSLNRAGSSWCYSCRTPSPVVAQAHTSGIRLFKFTSGLAFSAIALICALTLTVGFSGHLIGSSTARNTATPLAFVQVTTADTDAPSSDATTAATAEPTESATPVVKATPMPTDSPVPTVVSTPAPLQRPRR
jgi:hypothetical protein